MFFTYSFSGERITILGQKESLSSYIQLCRRDLIFKRLREETSSMRMNYMLWNGYTIHYISMIPSKKKVFFQNGVYQGSILASFLFDIYFEHQRKLIKSRLNFLYKQLAGLNKLLPIRHMTQLWNSNIKPHLDYVAPLMRYFSHAHLIKWQQLYRQSIKKVLKLPQFLANEEIDKIWEQFGFRPNAILKSTQEQLGRFYQELKRTNQPFNQIKLWQIINDLNYELVGIMIKKSEINNQLYGMKEEERLVKSNLKIKYIPTKGYLERYKDSWQMCKCGERWNFFHLKDHDPQLMQEYDQFEDELNKYLLSGSQIYLLQFYQDYVCEKIDGLNKRMHILVESKAETYVKKQNLDMQ